jgi:hypothetical protein
MKFRYFGVLTLSCLLAACGFNIEQPEPVTSTAPILTLANNTLIATITPIINPTPTPTATYTYTPTIQPTATVTPTSRILSELGGSQAWIEKNFKPYGFQFSEPYGNGERTATYGNLVLQKSNGDLYDMEMQILITSIGYSVIRSQLLVIVKQPLSEKEMSFVLELFRLLWATSTDSDNKGAADWINATLPVLKPNMESKTNFGMIQTRINIAPANGDFGYSLTLAVPGED